MAKKVDPRFTFRKMVPRIAKAAFLGITAYLTMYFVSTLIMPIQPYVPWYEPMTNVFTVVYILLLVVSTLSSGTILQYVLGVIRTFVSMIFFIFVLNGGNITLSLPIDNMEVTVGVNLLVFLSMITLTCLLGIGKNIVQMLTFLSDKAELKRRILQ